MTHTAFVTGGARGIGAAVVQALAADGHQVVIGDVLDDLARTTADSIGGMAVYLDVTDSASVAEATRKAELELGPIDILVNNAGWDAHKRFLETDEAFWDEIINLNYKGCLRMCRTLAPGMVDRRYGRVVNIASDAARVGSSMEAVYAGAKAAVVGFTKTLARELARYGVTANCVCPGPTDTPLLAEMIGAGAAGAQLIESIRRAVPMRRLAVPDDIAGAVAFLASDRAGFITGQTLSVSGGLTMA
jgi:2-hydroxycyclohexanecarboxyl-CoA dehydrogenase